MKQISRARAQKILGSLYEIEHEMDDFGYTFKEWRHQKSIKAPKHYKSHKPVTLINSYDFAVVTDNETNEEFYFGIWETKCPECHKKAIASSWFDGGCAIFIDCENGHFDCVSEEKIDE